MPVLDRSILRLATYELIAEPDVPVAVVIDEAVELAKQYSTGILRRLRERRAVDDRPPGARRAGSPRHAPTARPCDG